MILGVTHDEHGEVINRLPVILKVSIGEPPANEKDHPKKLDHFQIKRKHLVGKDIKWEPDADIMRAYPSRPTELGIILLDDDPEAVFRTSFAWWTATECKCHGELVQIGDRWKMQATRRTKQHPDGEPWPGNYVYKGGPKDGQPYEQCGDGCPDYELGDCKPSGDLYFILEKFPIFGGVVKIHTSSYQSIKNISSFLNQVYGTFKRLRGMKAKLKMGPEKISYGDKTGRHSTTAQILRLEIDATGTMGELVDNMTETARLFDDTRKMLGVGRIQIEEDPEPAVAPHIAGEFYPREPGDDDLPAGAMPAAIPMNFEESAQRQEIHALCGQLQYNAAKEAMLVGKFNGRLGELVADLKLRALDSEPQTGDAR
jgi:hypothetical protein